MLRKNIAGQRLAGAADTEFDGNIVGDGGMINTKGFIDSFVVIERAAIERAFQTGWCHVR